jgi:hypothetical protein
MAQKYVLASSATSKVWPSPDAAGSGCCAVSPLGSAAGPCSLGSALVAEMLVASPDSLRSLASDGVAAVDATGDSSGGFFCPSATQRGIDKSC